jgi:hypothetical protein
MLCCFTSRLFKCHAEHRKDVVTSERMAGSGVKRALEASEVDRALPISGDIRPVEPLCEPPIISRPRIDVGTIVPIASVGIPGPEPTPKPFDETRSCLGACWELNGGCFVPVLDSRNEMTHAKCTLCDKEYVHKPSQGTSNMNKHWLTKHGGSVASLHATIKSSPLTEAHQWHNDRACAALIILDGGPITRTRNPFFKWGMRQIVGDWVVSLCQAVKNADLVQLSHTIR